MYSLQMRHFSLLFVVSSRNFINVIFLAGYWADKRNRKEFFEAFARGSGFDALVAENWYPVTTQQIKAIKVWEGWTGVGVGLEGLGL